MKPINIFVEEAIRFKECPSLQNWRCLESAMLMHQQAYYGVKVEVDQAAAEYKVNCQLRETSFGTLAIGRKLSRAKMIATQANKLGFKAIEI